ncbi:MAG: NAD(P)/FAD-dependent oxidoreductase [Anaerolineales bacterium]|nr:NAD(P)/FAD-dependent oxidoreductase [Anaerolineales bacterium]
MTVAILGGGIMGVSLGYILARAGVPVEIFEASPVLGGLAGPLVLPDGAEVDRFYHAILSSDRYLGELAAELGLTDRMRFNETKTAFYYRGQLHSMNNIIEFFRFPPLGWVDRFRLGLTVLYAQFVRDWRALESISVEKWLLGLSGRTTFQNIWRPMLKAKFDGGFENTPATWIWSRLVRMKSTRGGASQKEMAGYVIGGYATLLKAMAAQIEKAGSQIHLRTPVQEIVIENGRAVGVRLGGEVRRFEAVVATMQAPVFQRLIPQAPADYLAFLNQTQYLGIICPVMVLDRPLTGYWTVNITDDRFPFTGLIETTSYINPADVGGHHLVYLPKYTQPGSAWQAKTDDEIREIWLSNLEAMLPSFKREQVRYFLIHREKYVEPLHGLNETHLIPEIRTPVAGLFLATTAQIYPALTNGESVARHARSVAEAVRGAGQPA